MTTWVAVFSAPFLLSMARALSARATDVPQLYPVLAVASLGVVVILVAGLAQLRVRHIWVTIMWLSAWSVWLVARAGFLMPPLPPASQITALLAAALNMASVAYLVRPSLRAQARQYRSDMERLAAVRFAERAVKRSMK